MIIHDFDFLRWCFGGVERVYAKGLVNTHHFGKVDYALVTFRFASGLIAHVEGSWSHPGGFRTRCEIAGTKGLLSFDSQRDVPLRVETPAQATGGGVAVPESPVLEDPYSLELKHFIDCVKEGRAPCITAEDAYEALEMALAALESIETGRPVSLRKRRKP